MPTNKELTDWWLGKARTAAGYRSNIIANVERHRDTTVIGRLYFFVYDPKFKAILPIYDKFPLVFPMEADGNSMLGLNLHYLGQGERTVLLNRLTGFANNQRFNKTTKIKLSYDLLQSTKSLNSLARPCIKRYLWTHVRSRFIEITADEWPNAIALPVQHFVNKT
jgi:hypothetical protein